MPSARFHHILVVEDDVSLRFTLAEWLRHLHYVVYETANADEAKIILASPLPVDLVVTDVDMPGSMSGLDLVDNMRHAAPGIPAIVVSGNSVAHQITKAKGIPFFQKPYSFDKIATAIGTFITKNNTEESDHG
ncbi:MAG: response regulator [Pseudomonadota bacterium]